MQVKQVKLELPVVVRLDGTNAEEAARILRESDIDVIVADTLQDGAEKAVAAIQ